MHRLNQLFQQANEDSSRRVTIEQDRQWVHRAMEGLNSELARKGYWQGEIWNRDKSGEVHPMWVTVLVKRNALDEVTIHQPPTHGKHPWWRVPNGGPAQGCL